MNQLCKVCGEPAAGFHFGAFTCEGCKSFFGRTYNNIGSISECKNNGECVINKKNRTACKACRLRKCLLVGMSKSGSRYGRRSNWFKIHCLLQEQQQAGANMAAAAGLLRPHPYLSPLFRTATTTATPAASRSSDSDSGASSADPEDDAAYRTKIHHHNRHHNHHHNHQNHHQVAPPSPDFLISSASMKKLPSPASDSECFDRRKFISALVNAPSVSPASLPSISPGTVLPKWLPPLQGVADPSAWRELWSNQNNNNEGGGRANVVAAAPAADQVEPIDLSIKQSPSPPPSDGGDSDPEMCIDVGVDEPVKSVPLDLTLDRQSADVAN